MDLKLENCTKQNRADSLRGRFLVQLFTASSDFHSQFWKVANTDSALQKEREGWQNANTDVYHFHRQVTVNVNTHKCQEEAVLSHRALKWM